jgi:tripartite-type tricarboxylate transporter receptor subunit TctC
MVELFKKRREFIMKKGSNWNKLLVLFVLCISLIGATGVGYAQKPAVETAWTPNHTITLIVSVAAGGQVDTTIRGMVPYLIKYLGGKTTIMVENRAGAAGRIASQAVYDAKPDGYTILATNASDVAMYNVSETVRYKTEDFTYVGSFCNEGAGLIASKGSGIKSVADLVAASKKKPVTYGAVHLASQNHMCSYFLCEAAGINARIVPYAGGAPMLGDLMGNSVQVGLVGLTLAVQANKDGRVVLINQLSDHRSKIAPDVPAIKELYPGYKGSNYTFGVMAPPKMPANIKKAWVDAYQKTVKDPEFLKWADGVMLDIKDIGPEAMATLMANDKKLYESLPDVIAKLKAAGDIK